MEKCYVKLTNMLNKKHLKSEFFINRNYNFAVS